MLASSIFAQDKNIIEPISIGARFHTGFIIQHSEDVESVQGAKPKGIELTLSWFLNGDNTWHQCLCYPKVGFMYSFFDYGNKNVLGVGHTLAGYFEHYFRDPGWFNISLRGGMGYTYATKAHDRNSNKSNMSYAMATNWRLFLNLGVNFQIDRHLELKVGASMNHDSNANIKEPNGGVNYPTVSIGFDYTINPPDIDPDRPPTVLTPEERNKSRTDLILYGAMSAYSFPDSGQFPMVGVTLLHSFRISRIHALYVAGEFEYNGRAKQKNSHRLQNKYDHHRASFIFGHEFLLGRTKIGAGLGVYIYRPLVESDVVYQRWHVIHHLTPNFMFGMGFKSYRHVADFVDLRIGYSF